jgi:hypothetical protein
MLQIGVGRHRRCRRKGERTFESLRMGRGARLFNSNCSNLDAQGLGFQGFDFVVGRGCLDRSDQESYRDATSTLCLAHMPTGAKAAADLLRARRDNTTIQTAPPGRPHDHPGLLNRGINQQTEATCCTRARRDPHKLCKQAGPMTARPWGFAQQGHYQPTGASAAQ